MGCAHQRFNEDQYSAILHAPTGEGICGEVVYEGIRIIRRGGALLRPYMRLFMIPEITVTELSEKLKSKDAFILLDVRELDELDYAKLTDSRLEVTPMSQLAQVGIDALSESAKSQSAEIYV